MVELAEEIVLDPQVELADHHFKVARVADQADQLVAEIQAELAVRVVEFLEKMAVAVRAEQREEHLALEVLEPQAQVV